MQGKSFAALLSKPEGTGKDVAYTVVSRGKLLGRSIRTRRWRYAEWGSPEQAELYDLQADPHEDHNLANVAEYRQQRRAMHKILVNTQAEAQAKRKLTK